MESLRLPKRTRNTIAKIADLALEILPMTFSASDLGTGRKVFFPLPLKHRPVEMSDFIYVYVESKVIGEPKDRDLGFTDEDVMMDTGVYLFKKLGEQHVSGDIYPLETLLRDVITDGSLRNRLIYRINEMKTLIRLDEEFLQLANMELMMKKYAEIKTSTDVHSQALH